MSNNVNFANLTTDQLTAIQLFEKNFNSEYHTDLFIMAIK
jgi:hypothetical protein